MLTFATAHLGCVLACSTISLGWSGDDLPDIPPDLVQIENEIAGSESDAKAELSMEDLVVYQADWIYVAVPQHGNYPLQEVFQVGTPGWAAFQDVGVSINAYEPVAMVAPIANANNMGVVVMMLTPQCLGDYNHDSVVNAMDAPLFGAAFVAGDPSADLNHNGYIEIIDQLIFISLVGHPCVPAW